MPDNIEAIFIELPQSEPALRPKKEELRDLLLRLLVKEEYFHEETLTRLAHGPVSSRGSAAAIVIARGRPALAGTDAQFVLHVDIGQQAGEVSSDGTIDLRERRLVQSVRTGQLLAEKIPPGTGKPGCNLFGEEVAAPDGHDLEIEVGVGVRIETQESRTLYYADSDGHLVCGDHFIAVSDILRIEGDVSYATGNIDTPKDLHISGSVCSGFRVKAGGDAIIAGTIDAGASVTVQGNLSVGKGILGAATKVVVFGQLSTLFIQEAQVIAKGDIRIGSYIFNASVRSAGRIVVQRQRAGRYGRVVGGLVCASKGIEASIVGSPANQTTLLSIEPDPERALELAKLTDEIQECTVKISKIMRTLGLETVDVPALRRVIDGAPPAKKKLFVQIVAGLGQLVKQKQELKGQEQTLKRALDRELRAAVIRIIKEVHQGSTIQIGTKRLQVPHDLGPTTFSLDEDERIRM